MLSFSEGRPIARILSGKYKGKILKIAEEETKNIEADDPYDLITEDEIRNVKKMSITQIEALRRSLKTRRRDDYDDGDIYDNFSDKLKTRQKKELILNNGELMQLPTKNTRECIYVAGASGSGKTTYIARYLEEYKRMFPKNKIYIFSKLHDDEALDALHPIRIVINEELIDNPITAEELENSCVVFDDIDTLEKGLMEAVTKLRDDLLEIGRHNNIYMCNVSHLLMNYKSTRRLLNESQTVTFFPKSGSSYHITRFLKVYAGLGREDIQRIINLPSRWVTINKTYPNYILYSQGAYLLSK